MNLESFLHKYGTTGVPMTVETLLELSTGGSTDLRLEVREQMENLKAMLQHEQYKLLKT
jgi:hypothetical protein